MALWLFKLEVVSAYPPRVHYYGTKAAAKFDARSWADAITMITREPIVRRGPDHPKGETGITVHRVRSGRLAPDWRVWEGEGEHWPVHLEGRAIIHPSCDRPSRPRSMPTLVELCGRT